MDLGSVTFIGLITVGVVNVITFFATDLKSEVKFGIAVLTAFALSFVPPELGNVILDKAKLALEVAFAMSGTYKIASKVGSQ